MSLKTTQLPLYQDDKTTQIELLSDTHERTEENCDVVYHTWGIFTIAHVAHVSRRVIPPLPDLASYQPFQASYRLWKDLWRLDRCSTFLFMLCNLCIAIAPAFSLYFVHRVTLFVEELGSTQITNDYGVKDLQATVFNWVVSESIFCGFEIVMSRAKIRIRNCLRAYFIPQLVRARLIRVADEDEDQFPYPHEYGDLVPAWEFIESFATRSRNLMVLIANVVTFIIIIWQRRSAEVVFLYALVLISLVVAFTPMDATGGNGYIFWTDDVHYNRLMALFNIVFNPKDRTNIIRDGLEDILCKEYQKESDQLGAAGPDAWVVGCGIPPVWYRSLMTTLITKYPMALYTFCALHFHRSLNLGSVVIFHCSLFRMRDSIRLQFSSNESFLDLMCQVQNFYDLLEVPNSKVQDKIAYPNKHETHASGMKISARRLSCNPIDDVDFDIEPGNMIVVTGCKESGKTTLVKFLSGVLQPLRGEILVDGESISKYDPTQLRRSIVFSGQDETIYPVSVKENITMGLGLLDDSVTDARIYEAVHRAGAADVVRQLGLDTVTMPCSINGYSINPGPEKAAIDVLKRHWPTTCTELTEEERQRIIVARALFRAMNSESIKLVIIDQATSALDGDDEFNIMMQFKTLAKERGQTLIIVTHRLSEELRRHANLTLYVKDGRVELQPPLDNPLHICRGNI